MSEIFERVFALIERFIQHLLPWVICGDDEVGLIRRLGVYKRALHPGLNLKWPVIEEAMLEVSALDSTMLREQSLTTSDGVSVTLRVVVSYRVVDPRRYILDCATAVSVLNDVGTCVVSDVVPRYASAEVLKSKVFAARLLKPMRLRARKWGVKVEDVGLADRVQTNTYRFIGSSPMPDSVPQ